MFNFTGSKNREFADSKNREFTGTLNLSTATPIGAGSAYKIVVKILFITGRGCS